MAEETSPQSPVDFGSATEGTPVGHGSNRLDVAFKVVCTIGGALAILGALYAGVNWFVAQLVEDALDTQIRPIEESFTDRLARIEDDLDDQTDTINSRLAAVETSLAAVQAEVQTVGETVREILRRLTELAADGDDEEPAVAVP